MLRQWLTAKQVKENNKNYTDKKWKNIKIILKMV